MSASSIILARSGFDIRRSYSLLLRSSWSSTAPLNHESMPGPVAMASQTSSGVASTSMSLRTSNGWAMSGLLPLGLGRRGCHARVDGHYDPVNASSFRCFVVVPPDQGGHRARQLLGERGAIRGGSEPNLPVHGERGHPLPRLCGAGDER